MRMIHLDPEPVRVRAVIGKMEAGIVDMDPAVLPQVLAGILYLDAEALSVREMVDPDFELDRVESTIFNRVLLAYGGLVREFHDDLHAPPPIGSVIGSLGQAADDPRLPNLEVG